VVCWPLIRRAAPCGACGECAAIWRENKARHFNSGRIIGQDRTRCPKSRSAHRRRLPSSVAATPIAATPSMPATIAWAAFGSRPGPAATQRTRKPASSRNCSSRGRSEAPDRFQASHQQSRQAEHRHEDWNRQHRRQWRGATADDVRGQDDQVAGDVGGEQPAQPKEADDVHASRSHAEHARQQLRTKRTVDRGRRHPSRPAFSFRRHRDQPSFSDRRSRQTASRRCTRT
jgi:hypothetical protein